MRKSRFTEAQIIGMIKEQESGMPMAEVCRKNGLSQGTFYKYKSKYGGMEVSDVAKLRAIEDENARLKRLLADTMLDDLSPNFRPKILENLSICLWLYAAMFCKLVFKANSFGVRLPSDECGLFKL